MLLDIRDSFISIFEDYGWYILLFGVVLAYVYHNVLKSYISNFQKYRDDQEYVAKYHKDPDLFVARQVAQQQSAMKLQEKYRKDAEEYQKRLEQKEAKKKEELMKKFNGDGGQKLGSGSQENSSFKPEYNPLMGSGSGSNYRPPRRSACSRGGCG
ncbi:hypothetical protein NQ318_014389 [Aromia moschata]|uniref:Selenoprotein S n=1 Tax=Aromia moschata TaxID=1265417 RepID=A0AAV8XPD1_9CUCU|nr:hypothetical protein NQ318_014389 [Aromia moschata]